METMEFGPANCPMKQALGVMGGRWKTILLFHLFDKGTMRFSSFSRLVDGITPKVLTEQLREMEKDGLVVREIFPVIPPRVEYTLSPFGKTLEPVIGAIKAWGAEHLLNQAQPSPV